MPVDGLLLSLEGAATSWLVEAVAAGVVELGDVVLLVELELEFVLDEVLEDVDDALCDVLAADEVVSSSVGVAGSLDDDDSELCATDDVDVGVGVVDRVNVGVDVGAVEGSYVDDAEAVVLGEGVVCCLQGGTG